MPPKKRKDLGSNNVEPAISGKIEGFVMRFKESRIPLCSDEFDRVLNHLYKRQTFDIETSYPLLKLAAITTAAVRQVQAPEGKDALSFLHSFRRIVRGLVGDTISLPKAPTIDAVSFTERDIIATYTLRFAAFAGISEHPDVSPKLFEHVAQILSEIPVTNAYLHNEHLPRLSKWQSTWCRLPIIPSIIIIADACLVSYNRTAATLHAYTQTGGLPGRAVGGACEKKSKSSQKVASSTEKTRSKRKGSGNAKAAVDEDIEEEGELSTEPEEPVSKGLFVSDDENDNKEGARFPDPLLKNKRSCQERASEPLLSNPAVKENLQLRRSARTRRSAPLELTASI